MTDPTRTEDVEEAVLPEDGLAETLQLLSEEGDAAYSEYAMDVMRSHEALRSRLEEADHLLKVGAEQSEALVDYGERWRRKYHAARRRADRLEGALRTVLNEHRMAEDWSLPERLEEYLTSALSALDSREDEGDRPEHGHIAFLHRCADKLEEAGHDVEADALRTHAFNVRARDKEVGEARKIIYDEIGDDALGRRMADNIRDLLSPPVHADEPEGDETELADAARAIYYDYVGGYADDDCDTLTPGEQTLKQIADLLDPLISGQRPPDEPVSGEGERRLNLTDERGRVRDEGVDLLDSIDKAVDDLDAAMERYEPDKSGEVWSPRPSVTLEGHTNWDSAWLSYNRSEHPTHADARSEVPPTFEAMMRSIGPVPPEMYRDLQEVWERHYSDLRRLSDRHEDEDRDDG